MKPKTSANIEVQRLSSSLHVIFVNGYFFAHTNKRSRDRMAYGGLPDKLTDIEWDLMKDFLSIMGYRKEEQ